MIKIQNVSRRTFLQASAALGGSFALGLFLDPLTKLHPFYGKYVGMGAASAAEGASIPGTLSPNVFVSIDKTGTVTIVAHRSEMGQGVRTTVPMILADELEADWSRVKIEQATGDKIYGNQYTDGSRSVRHNYERMREFGAITRTMLEQAAAIQWGVSVLDCKAKNHKVVHVPSGRTFDYGELVETASSLKVPSAKRVTLKEDKDFRYIGKQMGGVDIPDMMVGKAQYAIDVRMPNMLYAVVEHCPVTYGKVKSFDASEALKVPGVKQVVEIPQNQPPIVFNTLGGVAVVATNTWAANEGRKRLKVQWDLGSNVSYNSDNFHQTMADTARQPGKVVREEGNVEQALMNAHKVVKADFYVPHYSHATMEPPSAVAFVKDGMCEVWSCCQDPQAARATVAGAIGMDEKNVTSRVTLLGGAFGRKSKPDFAAEAAILSRQFGVPVKVTWTREDDLQHAYYHTPTALHMEAGLDKSGKVTGWKSNSVFPTIWSTFEVPDPQLGHPIELSLGYLDVPYNVPNLRLENGKAKAHVRIGWLRSVNNIPNAFAQNSMANMLAHEAGKDPYQFLLELIGPDRILDLSKTAYWNYDQTYDEYPIMTSRLKGVLKVAAEQAGYGKKLGPREAIGVAVHRCFTTYVATAVRVQVAADGSVAIPRIDVACDAGRVINPDRVISQMEGASIYGLTACFSEITAKNGAIQQTNFNEYTVARMPLSPKEIRVHLVNSGGQYPPGGVGEPGTPPFAPALCNAIFAATGKRITELPIDTSKLKA